MQKKQLKLDENTVPVKMKRHYFYKKDRREYVPIEDEKLNLLAKKKLENLLAKDDGIKIPEKFRYLNGNLALFNSGGNLEKATSLYLIEEQTTYDLSNKLNELTAKEWLSETVTVFAQKGLGANSKEAEIEKQHPAPFSFQDVSKIMKFFTKKGDKVLDPFSGVGSTLKACAFDERIGYGIELNGKYHKLTLERLAKEVHDDFSFKKKQNAIHGDSLKELKKFKKKYFDFIITSPPYWNILDTVDHKVNQMRVSKNLDSKYSESKKDLANISDYNEFLSVLSDFFNDCYDILADDKYLCIIVSDFRKKDKYFVYHADLANEIEKKGKFQLKGIRILHQRHKSIYPYGYPFTFVPNMHHQNVLIFQKKK